MATDNTGSANSPYDSITTETISGEISAAPHNTNDGNLKTAAQSHTHPLDSRVGWDSMKANFRPPDTGDNTNRWRIVSGEKNITVTGGQNYGGDTITFATDAAQGDPSFTTAPAVVMSVEGQELGYGFIPLVFSPTTTTVYCRVFQLSGGLTGGSLVVHWIACGKIA